MEPTPDGGSLHEMAVVASFVKEQGQELAERYLLHETIQQYKLANQLQQYYCRLGHEPPSKLRILIN